MENNVVKDNTLKNDTPSKFNLSSYLTPTSIHVAIEVIMACIFFVYFNRKINNQKNEYETRISDLETQVKAIEALLKEIVTGQPSNPQPQQNETFIQPKVRPTMVVEPIPMNFFQEFMQGVGGLDTGFQGNDNTSSITEVKEKDEVEPEPVSREQLDKELTEELNDLKSSNKE